MPSFVRRIRAREVARVVDSREPVAVARDEAVPVREEANGFLIRSRRVAQRDGGHLRPAVDVGVGGTQTPRLRKPPVDARRLLGEILEAELVEQIDDDIFLDELDASRRVFGGRTGERAEPAAKHGWRGDGGEAELRECCAARDWLLEGHRRGCLGETNDADKERCCPSPRQHRHEALRPTAHSQPLLRSSNTCTSA